MIIAVLAFGLFFGLSAATLTFVSGGSILLMLAAYSGVGALALIGLILVVLINSETQPASNDWLESGKKQDVISA